MEQKSFMTAMTGARVVSSMRLASRWPDLIAQSRSDPAKPRLNQAEPEPFGSSHVEAETVESQWNLLAAVCLQLCTDGKQTNSLLHLLVEHFKLSTLSQEGEGTSGSVKEDAVD